jgi:hypothetical protein
VQRKGDPLTRGQHRKIAGDLFNYTWSLMTRKARGKEEIDELLHAAHASRYHWGHGGTLRNLSIGEWQVSRVYAMLGRSEAALYHGRRALEAAHRGALGRFYLAYAYEALARAAALAGQRRARNRYLRAAHRFGAAVRNREERRTLLADLATVP